MLGHFVPHVAVYDTWLYSAQKSVCLANTDERGLYSFSLVLAQQGEKKLTSMVFT